MLKSKFGVRPRILCKSFFDLGSQVTEIRNYPYPLSYSNFIKELKNKKIHNVVIDKHLDKLFVADTDEIVELPDHSNILELLLSNNVNVDVKSTDNNKLLLENIESIFVFMISSVIFMMIFRLGSGQGPSGGLSNFMKSNVKINEATDKTIMFKDVAGCETAKQEVMEIVDFLKAPEKYTVLGAKIPKGCLLVGPPGTGKTLLARAVAGEAGVPFISASASEFMEMFVGIGASRIRDMFNKAKSVAPCIIFIDEIDAIGKKRSSGPAIGNDEKDQTLNQLLTLMDGFESNTGIVVIASTNREDILDDALLRPGRFDRKVTIGLPDINGRTDILKVHTKNKPLDNNCDLHEIAKFSIGFSGADLANLSNEAAIYAVRANSNTITFEHFNKAFEKIVIGLERSNSLISVNKKKIIAIHESGHVLVSLLVDNADKLRKVTIIPAGSAGGVAYFTPNSENIDSGLYSKKYLENQIMIAFGGRIAEEVIFGSHDITTGASSDLISATNIARKMITLYGFSDLIGASSWNENTSPEVQNKIDQEIIATLKILYERTKNILVNNIDKLNLLANELMEKESLSGEEVIELLKLQ